jgi:tetratricopeptide (TPR) repeat protein
MAPLLVRPTFTAWLGNAAMATIFHLALAATILWPDWLTSTERGLLWAALGVAWLTGVAWSYRFVRQHTQRSQRRALPDPFPQAIHAYLAGNLAQAESLVRAILRESPRDVEAALLLATIWRRRGRLDAAEKLLRNLARLDVAHPWLWEIERELVRVAQAREEQASESLPTSENESLPSGEPSVRECPPGHRAITNSSNAMEAPYESGPASKAA